MPTDLITTNEAALLAYPNTDPDDEWSTRNARRKIWWAKKKGHFPSARKIGRDWLFDRLEVEAYAAAVAAGTVRRGNPGRPRTTGAGLNRKREAPAPRPEGHLSTDEAAALIWPDEDKKEARERVTRYASDGSFPNAVKPGDRWWIPRADVEAFITFRTENVSAGEAAALIWPDADGRKAAKRILYHLGLGRFVGARKVGNTWWIPRADVEGFVETFGRG